MIAAASFAACASATVLTPPPPPKPPSPPPIDWESLSTALSSIQELDAAAEEPPIVDDGVRRPTAWVAPPLPPSQRSDAARERRLPLVTKLFEDAGVPFPPQDLLFRVFKKEFLLEVWAAEKHQGEMKKVATYGICRMSGGLGPKRKEGDRKVPEGFYFIRSYLPNSNYLLEMNISYPSRADLCLPEKNPGTAIMIHGACASAGCVSMSDERAEELWVMASAVDPVGRGLVEVHLFPSRSMDTLLADEAFKEHWAFWANLKEGFDFFEREKRLPIVTNDWRGRYLFR